MSLNNLIIKLGAMGDVVRTTPLLRILGGDIYWVTKKESLPLLTDNSRFVKGVIDIDKAGESLSKINFDLVLSLDDDRRAAGLAAILNKDKLIGSFLDPRGELKYTDSAAEWFDMSLISSLGKEKADELKKENARTYQEFIFGMVRRQFKGEEYVLNFKGESLSGGRDRKKILIGIENRADKRWPVSIGLPDEEGYPHQGQLDFASISLTSTTGTLLMRGVFSNPDGKVLPGLFARVRVPVERKTAFLVPEVAVSNDQQGPYVLIVNDSNVVERRNVTTGSQVDNQRVIEKGLTGKERIIVKGLLRAIPGRQVTPEPEVVEPPAKASPQSPGKGRAAS